MPQLLTLERDQIVSCSVLISKPSCLLFLLLRALHRHIQCSRTGDHIKYGVCKEGHILFPLFACLAPINVRRSYVCVCPEGNGCHLLSFNQCTKYLTYIILTLELFLLSETSPQWYISYPSPLHFFLRLSDKR